MKRRALLFIGGLAALITKAKGQSASLPYHKATVAGMTPLYGKIVLDCPATKLNATTWQLRDVAAQTVMVYRNGVRQKHGVDYTLSVDKVQFATAPAAGDILIFDYVV